MAYLQIESRNDGATTYVRVHPTLNCLKFDLRVRKNVHNNLSFGAMEFPAEEVTVTAPEAPFAEPAPYNLSFTRDGTGAYTAIATPIILVDDGEHEPYEAHLDGLPLLYGDAGQDHRVYAFAGV